MSDPINTNNRVRGTGVSADTRADSARQTGAAGTKPDTGSARDASTVELQNATLLQQLEDKIKELPQVNEARVAAVKQALSDGEYEPDAEVIARKFSEIEKLLP